MVEQDTIRLLRECDAGIKMGVDSLKEVIPHVKNENLKNCLSDCLGKHSELDREIDGLLNSYHDEGKDPNPIAKGMSHLKTNFKMGINDSDETITDLMTDGCNMGVKSLSKYLNKYKAADEKSKDITKRLINIEESLAVDIREYL